MSTFRQFRDLPDPTRKFDELFRAALQTLLPDLADAPWYVREREVVNLFVRHLIPQFQNAGLDISQIGIEIPVRKYPKTAKEKHGKYADIVVWSHNKATRWRNCRPLIHIEWKNISCREKTARTLERQHEKDIGSLMDNREFVCVSYAVLTDWRDEHVEVRCKRILGRGEPEDFFRPTGGATRQYPSGLEARQTVAGNNDRPWCLSCAATCAEHAITDLQGSLQSLRLNEQACPDCIASRKQVVADVALNTSGREASAARAGKNA
jgi:hypothetical protein